MSSLSIDMDSYVDDVLKDFGLGDFQDFGDFEILGDFGNNGSSSIDNNATNKNIKDMLDKVLLGKILSI